MNKLFQEYYKNAIMSSYAQDLINHWREKNIRSVCYSKNISNRAILGRMLNTLKFLIGGFHSKVGIFFENRLKVINNIVYTYKDSLGIHPIGFVSEREKINNLTYSIPRKVKNLIQVCVNDLYDGTKSLEDVLKIIFQELVDSLEDTDCVSIRHDIDNVLQVYEKRYLLESKTSSISQNDNLKGCIKRTIETWSCLMLYELREEKKSSNYGTIIENVFVSKVHYDDIGIIWLLNGEKDNIGKYPKWCVENERVGGTITIDMFYKKYFDISYEDVVFVELEIGECFNSYFMKSILDIFIEYAKEGLVSKKTIMNVISFLKNAVAALEKLNLS